MKLIGMLDSPYVRRVAISLRLMGIAHEHESVSVFRHIDRFRQINPLVKAPTLVCDDGEVLMDSTLILDYLDGLVAPAARLLPAAGRERRDALQRIGVALVACEKAVQHYYEQALRPPEKQHAAWLERVDRQARDAFDWLEKIASSPSLWPADDPIKQDALTIAVTWRFVEFTTPDLRDAARYPALAALSKRAEALPAFRATPLD